MTLIIICAPKLAFGADAEVQSNSIQKWKDIAGEMSGWARHVRGFRSEHNFAFGTFGELGKWSVQRVDGTASSAGVGGYFEYSYHLPIYRSAGAILGSRISYGRDLSGSVSGFRPSASIGFPGVLGGFVLNVNPYWRIGLGVDWHLERYEGIKVPIQDGEPKPIYVTIRSLSYGILTDIFFSLYWAIRFETGVRYLKHEIRIEAEGFPVDSNIEKQARWLSVGLVRHLL